jgi:hypothetical protein
MDALTQRTTPGYMWQLNLVRFMQECESGENLRLQMQPIAIEMAAAGEPRSFPRFGRICPDLPPRKIMKNQWFTKRT